MVDHVMILKQSNGKTKTTRCENEGKKTNPDYESKTEKYIQSASSNQLTKDPSVSKIVTGYRSIFKDISILKAAKDTLNRKSITIDGQVYETIKHIKHTMSKHSHGRFSFNMVIQSLLQDHVDLQNLRSEIELIKKEMEGTQTYLKEMLKLALVNSKSQVQYIPISGQSPPSPPPTSPPRSSQKKINYTPPNTGNLMRDYVKEIKLLFTGEILRPSDVVNITKPTHGNVPVNNLKEDYLIPNIELISVAKHFKPLTEEESDV